QWVSRFGDLTCDFAEVFACSFFGRSPSRRWAGRCDLDCAGIHFAADVAHSSGVGCWRDSALRARLEDLEVDFDIYLDGDWLALEGGGFDLYCETASMAFLSMARPIFWNFLLRSSAADLATRRLVGLPSTSTMSWTLVMP